MTDNWREAKTHVAPGGHLSKTVCVLDYVPTPVDESDPYASVVFSQANEDFPGYGPECSKELVFEHSSWVHMGRPTKITLTVEPGDLLNGIQTAEFIGD